MRELRGTSAGSLLGRRGGGIVGLALALALVLAVLLAGAASTAHAAPGYLKQLSGKKACISGDGSSGFSKDIQGACTQGYAGIGPLSDMAVSPDGKNLYGSHSTSGEGSIATYTRKGNKGAISKLGNCIAEFGLGPCSDGHAIDGSDVVKVSPDGKHVYLGSSRAVAPFDRNPATGALSQTAGRCVAETNSIRAKPNECKLGAALNGIIDIAISPDGKNVYAAAGQSRAVAVLDRNPATGAVTQKAGTDGCISEDGSSGEPDYIAGTCFDGHTLGRPGAIDISPDGKNVYVASGSSFSGVHTGPDGVAVFDRDLATGKLSQKPGPAGCVTETGSGGQCQDGRQVGSPGSLIVSADGNNVYVGGDGVPGGLAVFDRAPNGVIQQKPGLAGCFSDAGDSGPPLNTQGACSAVLMDQSLESAHLVESPDGKNLYTSGYVSLWDRDPATGEIARKLPPYHCLAEGGFGCLDALTVNGGGFNTGLVSPDGRNFYYPGAGGITSFSRFSLKSPGKLVGPNKQKQGKKIKVKGFVRATLNLKAMLSGKIKVGSNKYPLKGKTFKVKGGKKKKFVLKLKQGKHAQKVRQALKKGKNVVAKAQGKLFAPATGKVTEKYSPKLK